MHKAVRSFVVLAMLVVVVAGCSDGGERRPRRNTIAYTFGDGRQEMVIKHTFQVPNPTPDPMTIAKVQSTCGCTSTVVKEGAVIEPGKSLDIPVELNLRGKEGKVESKVILYYGPTTLPTELLLQGQVIKEFEDAITYAKIKRGDQPERTVELKTYAGEPELAISGLTFDAAKFEVTSAQGATPGTFTIKVKPVANPAYGPLDDDIVVHTNDTEVPDKTIHVHAHVMKPLEATKSRLTLQEGDGGKEASGIAEFTTTYGGNIEAPTVSVTRPKRFTATVEPDSPAGTLRVRVVGIPPPGKDKQYTQTTLTVTAKVNGEEVTEKMDVYLMLSGTTPAMTDDEAEAKRDQDSGKPKGRVKKEVSSPAEVP